MAKQICWKGCEKGASASFSLHANFIVTVYEELRELAEF